MREECIVQWNQEVNDWLAYVEQRKAELETEDTSDSLLGKKVRLHRQIRALYQVKHGIVMNPDLIFDCIDPKRIVSSNDKEVKVYYSELDTVKRTTHIHLEDHQKDAVKKFVNMDNLLVIQGPPGTGKTSVIVEICAQILMNEPESRILVCSETHVAVNNLFHILNEMFDNFEGIRILDKEVDEEGYRKKFLKDTFIEKYWKKLRDKKVSENIIRYLMENWTDNEKQFNEMLFYSSRFVGITCSGIGGMDFAYEHPFDYVIVDEDSKISFPELLMPMCWAKKFILVGDPKQLPPSFSEEERENMDSLLQRIDGKDTFIDRIYDQIPECAFSMLNIQHRMSYEIADIVNKYFYNGLLKNGSNVQSIKGSLRWADYDTDNKWLIPEEGSTSQKHFSVYNLDEVEIVHKIILQEYQRYKQILQGKEIKRAVRIEVISPYTGQKRKLAGYLFKQDDIKQTKDIFKIGIHTIDQIQGRDSEIVIFSIARNIGNSRFIANDRRLNVAFSRAKERLWIVGQRKYTDNISVMIKGEERKILKEIAEDAVVQKFVI